jgi:2-haloacid dehalogenase
MLERGEIEKKVLMWKRFEAFCARTGLEADPRALAADYLQTLSTKSYMIEGALAVCQNLAQKCRMYIITNGDKRVQQGRFNPSPLAQYFDAVYISEEVGFEKPDIRYFEAVMRDIPDFDPAITLVVGDSLTSDIKGGINAGLDTCWYNPKGKPVPADIPVTYVIHDLAQLPDLAEKGCL